MVRAENIALAELLKEFVDSKGITMKEGLIEDAVREKFKISVGIAEIRGVRQKVKESSEISREIAEVEEEIKSKYKIDEVKGIKTIRLQRDFFWRMGVDPTKVRPASEALLRRILLNKGLPGYRQLWMPTISHRWKHCLPSALLTSRG